jgi:hypothetical protein
MESDSALNNKKVALMIEYIAAKQEAKKSSGFGFYGYDDNEVGDEPENEEKARKKKAHQENLKANGLLNKKIFAFYEEKRKNEENGPIVFLYLKEILSLYGIPDSQHLCMLVNWHKLFPPRLEWDRKYCNDYILFHPEDETDITFSGSGWRSSVLGLRPNPTSFTIKIIDANSMAIGIAPRQGFTCNDPTMFTCGCYLYSNNALYSGGIPILTKNDKFPTLPQVYSPNSTITCIYEREKGELSFIYNGIDFGVGYRNIPFDLDYYVAVSCVGPVQIKLVEMKF